MLVLVIPLVFKRAITELKIINLKIPIPMFDGGISTQSCGTITVLLGRLTETRSTPFRG